MLGIDVEYVQDSEKHYVLCALYAMYITAFVDGGPTEKQLEIIKEIISSDAILSENHEEFKETEEVLSFLLSAHYSMSEDAILCDLSQMSYDIERSQRILGMAIKVSQGVEKISNNAQTVLNRISDALYL